MNRNHPYPIISFGFVKSYWIHMRPYLLFISCIAGLTGLAVVSNVTIPLKTFVLGIVPFFFGYGFGQAFTDSFQVDTDSISSPYRPVVQGIIRKRDLKWVSIVGLGFICAFFLPLNIYIIPVCTLMIIGLATYTYFKKNFWFAGPFYNAFIVMLLPVLGYMIGGPNYYIDLPCTKLLFLCAMTFFAYSNFVLIGYLKDIEADRQTNYNTFPVKFGWDKTVLIGDLLVLIAGFFCFIQLKTFRLSFVIALVGLLVAIWGQVKAHLSKIKNETDSKIPILATIRSFIIWHIAIIIQFRPGWYWFLLVFYVLFEITLASRPVKNQI